MARLLACLSLFLLVACGGASPRISSPQASGWEADVLGGPPDARLVLRLDQANADPVYGGPATPYDKRSTSDPELEALFRDVKTIELWFVADQRDADRSSLLVVVRGKPDFELLRTHRDARALFSKQPERLRSGVLAYDLPAGSTPLSFFLMPSGTWVIAAGRIAGRVRYHLFSHGEDPPPTPYEPDALLAFWVGPGASRLAGVQKHARGFEELSMAIRSSRSGDVEVSVKFGDAKHAREALDSVKDLLAELPRAQKVLADSCPAWERVRFDLVREDRALTGRVSNLPPLVRAYRTGACRYDEKR